MKQIKRFIPALAAVIILSSCASLKSEKLTTMPSPAVSGLDMISPYPGGEGPVYGETLPMLYVTNRIPLEDTSESPYYEIQRAEALRAGIAEIGIIGNERTWEDLSLLSSDENELRPVLTLEKVEDMGVLDETVTIFSTLGEGEKVDSSGSERFMEEIRKRMDRSGVNEVTIFIHGYNVNFANPVLMSSELWHYSGYRGAFLCFAWPATPKGTAYQQDLNKSLLSSRSLRLLIDYLEDQEEIEKINILGYSMGSGLAMQALYEKNLKHDPGEVSKIGNILLTNSDMDQGLFGSYLAEGAAELAEQITVYSSSQDLVLKGAQVIHSERRLGQIIKSRKTSPDVLAFYEQLPNVNFIDVSRADMAGAMGGHFYQTASPWVSSEIILNLMTSLNPAERGLVPDEELPVWKFPSDYIELTRTLLKENALGEG